MRITHHRNRSDWARATIAIAIFFTNSAFATDLWLTANPDAVPALEELKSDHPPRLDVLHYDENGIQLTVNTPGVALLPRGTEAGDFLTATWPDAAVSGEIGAPALPVVRRLFIVPPDATVSVMPTAGSTTVIGTPDLGFPLRVMPRQAPIEKIPGAIENAPFNFDPAAYAIDADCLGELATVHELGIVRGQRLFLLEVHPVAYNPATQIIELRGRLDVTIEFAGGGVPSDLNPLPGLSRVVLNPGQQVLSRGMGNYLIITPTTFEAQIAPFAAHKTSMGFSVITHVATSSSPTTIKSFIQSLWGTADAPDFILLVGDTQFIGAWDGGGDGSPDTDLPYTCMDGGDDWYPDLAIGRFPADDADELAAILDKTIYYDYGDFVDPDYFDRAVFMASEDNYTVSEGTHNWVINNYMNPEGIVSDKLYCHTYSATTQQVRNSFNDGRFYGIYSGHGGTYSWADGPVFSQSDVRNLTNTNMYSFVLSFACITGTYTVDECFTETWIIQPDKGAVGIWGSSVNSYWTEDDVLEKRWFDSIYDDDDDVPARFGPVFNEARMRYLAQMGGGSTTRRYFEMYNLLGDPSLAIREIIPPALSIGLPDGTPDTIDPGVVTPITVQILDLDETYVPGSGMLHYRSSGSSGFGTSPLTPLGGDLFEARLPAASCDDAPQFYFSAVGDGGTTVFEPPDAPDDLYATLVGTLIVTIDDSFETDQGWSVESSAGLSSGAWERGVPVGGGDRGDPASDFDGSGRCYLTENDDGDSDIDGGTTWLISPALDLSDGDAEVRYALWYTNDFGGDPDNDLFKTWVSDDDGDNWIHVETIGPDSDSGWVEHAFMVGDFVTPTATVRVRFEASDLGSGSVVEAGIDAFEVVALDCDEIPCPGDLDGDLDIDLADLAALLANYGMTSGAVYDDGDLDGDGDVDLSDLAALLAVFGTECD